MVHRVVVQFEDVLKGGPQFPGSKKAPVEAAIPAPLLGYLPYSDFQNKKSIQLIVEELRLRGREFRSDDKADKEILHKIKSLMKELQGLEKQRFAEYLRTEIRVMGEDPGDRNDVGELRKYLMKMAVNHEKVIKPEWAVDVSKNFKPKNAQIRWVQMLAIEATAV